MRHGGALVAGMAIAVAIGAGGCERAHGLDARCRAAQKQLYSAAGSLAVVRVCGLAHRATGALEPLHAVAKAHLYRGELDDVIAIAEAAPDVPASAVLWRLAGEASLQRGQHADAHRWLERTLAAQRDVDPKRACNAAMPLSDLAILDDDLERALDYAHQAMELALRSGDADARMRASLALTDRLLMAVGDPRAAAAVLDSVAELAGSKSAFLREYLLTRAEVEDRAGHPATAASMYERCLDVDPEHDPLVPLRCRLGLVRVRLTRGGADELAAAARDLAGAIALEPRVREVYGPDEDLAGERALLSAELDLAGDRRDAAVVALRELSRRPLGTSLRARVATRLGETLADLGRGDEAEVALTDAANAVEQLRDGAHYREARRALAGELREPYEALFALRAAHGNLPGALAAMDRALTRDFIDQLVAEPTRTGDRTIDQAVADAIGRAELRRRLDREAAATSRAATDTAVTTVVAFFSARGRLWRIAIAPGRSPSVEPIGALAELAPAIDRARGEPDGADAAALAARLFPPSVLPAADAPLVIVPDHALDRLRFAALRVHGRYLVELHPLALAPTLRLATDPPGDAGPPSAPVVLGDPTGDLPGALAEAREVAARVGVEPALGPAATRAALAGARRASLLHIASHGERDGGRSTLVLHDGPLSVGALLSLQLAPDLAVVASCVSAAQDRDAMWTSIAAALLAGGARGVLGVDGRLPDEEGRALVAGFYRHGGAAAPARALALAQRDAIAAGVGVDVWSMLVYLGSPSPNTAGGAR